MKNELVSFASLIPKNEGVKKVIDSTKSKNIVIIGGGSSLGYGLVQDLKNSSHKFIIVTSKKQLTFETDNVIVITNDLKNSDDVNKVCNSILTEFKRINVIFFNIGGGLGLTETLISYTDLQKLLWYNLGVIQEFTRKLVNKFCYDSRIICIGSVATKQITASLGYTISKTSLETYVRLMSRELMKKNIHIIAVSLGAFHIQDNSMDRLKTKSSKIFNSYIEERLPRKKMGSEEEILPFIKFLFFEEVGMFSGTVISMDGGESFAI